MGVWGLWTQVVGPATALVAGLVLVSGLPLPAAATPGTGWSSGSLGAPTTIHVVPVVVHTGPPLPLDASGPVRTSLSGGEIELRADNRDPSAFPNQGTETNLTAFAPLTLPAGARFQVSVVEIIGRHQAVFGIFQNSTSAPFPFYEMFNNTTNALERYVLWPGYQLASGTGYLFSIEHRTGGVWEFFVNHVPFGGNSSVANVSLNATEATWGAGLSFAVTLISPTTFVPPPVNAPLAFATFQSGAWYLPRVAAATNVGTPGFSWGIEGALQHPTLAPGEIATGPQVAPLASGTELWNGTPVPIRVNVRVSPTTVPANGPAQVTVTTARTDGQPLPGVFVQLTDPAGSSFQPATVETGPNGTGGTLLLAPNASRDWNENLQAVSTLFGFVGNATTPLTITAVEPVHVQAPADVSVAPAGSTGITFHTLSTNGSALAHIGLAFTINSTASVAPEGAFTDGTGSALAMVHAPRSPTTIYLIATVVGAGYWGVARVQIRVMSPVTPWYEKIAPYLAGAAVIVAAGVLTYLFALRNRAPPNPLPPFPRPRRGAAPPPAPPSEPPPPPPQP